MTETLKPLKPIVQPFFETLTNTYSYVVHCPQTHRAAVIDSVLNYDSASGGTAHESADEIVAYVREQGLTVDWLIETHAHADHLSDAPYLHRQLGGTTAIGARITAVQNVFTGVFNLEGEVAVDGSQFEHLFADGEHYSIGNLQAYVMATPGHTPACLTHVIGDAVFVGDTLFMPDGTARCDFPGGDAATLYQSIHKILALPEDFRLFVCHDYGPDGRAFACETTVFEQKQHNIHVREGIGEAEFVAMRTARDATLEMPKLILPSLQVNIRAGHFPAPEHNGTVYLKWPVNAFKKPD